MIATVICFACAIYFNKTKRKKKDFHTLVVPFSKLSNKSSPQKNNVIFVKKTQILKRSYRIVTFQMHVELHSSYLIHYTGSHS